jgi:hypothetical protein
MGDEEEEAGGFGGGCFVGSTRDRLKIPPTARGEQTSRQLGSIQGSPV